MTPRLTGCSQGLADAALDPHPGVEEGEQRQDEEDDERMEPLLEEQPRRLHVLRRPAQVGDGVELGPVVDHAVPGQVARSQGLALLPHLTDEAAPGPAPARTGISKASRTPATVACTPDSKTASQTPMARTR